MMMTDMEEHFSHDDDDDDDVTIVNNTAYSILGYIRYIQQEWLVYTSPRLHMLPLHRCSTWCALLKCATCQVCPAERGHHQVCWPGE